MTTNFRWSRKIGIGILVYLVIFCLVTACNSPSKENSGTPAIQPPTAEKIPHEVVTNGHTRVDNYHWMRLTEEQRDSDSKDVHTAKVIDYLNAENDYLTASLKDSEDLQEKIYNEIVGRIKQNDESVPYKSNGYWYYFRFSEGQEYKIYCRKKGSMSAREEILLDVNDLAKGHSYYSVTGLSVSEDNNLLAYAEDSVSRRRYTIYVKDLRTGKLTEKPVPNTEGDITWANDNKTYFYTRKDSATLRSRWIVRHKLSTDYEADQVVYEEKDETFYTGIAKTKSKKFLVIWSSSTLTTDFRILNANTPNGSFKQFTARERGLEYNIDHYDNKFYVITNLDAQNFRLMETPENQTAKLNWKEIIPHRKDTLISNIEVFKDYLVLSERANANTLIRIVDQKTGRKHYLDFGEPAYTVYPSVNVDLDTEIFRFGYTSLATPNSTFDYNLRT